MTIKGAKYRTYEEIARNYISSNRFKLYLTRSEIQDILELIARDSLSHTPLAEKLLSAQEAKA